MPIRRSQKKRDAEPRQKQNQRRLVIDPMVNPGSSAHRHQARSKAHPTRTHHRMVTLAQSSPGDRSACAPQSKTATVMLGTSCRLGRPQQLPRWDLTLRRCQKRLTFIPDLALTATIRQGPLAGPLILVGTADRSVARIPSRRAWLRQAVVSASRQEAETAVPASQQEVAAAEAVAPASQQQVVAA